MNYWCAKPVQIVVTILLWIIDDAFFQTALLPEIYLLLMLFPILDATIRRLHDTRKESCILTAMLCADEILKSFEEKAKAIELKIEKCEEEIRELIKLCDLLLPMLVNGQDRVERGKRKDEKHNKIICCI